MISIIIPIFNEERNLLPLYSRIYTTFSYLNKDYEIIYIDDGSYDKSYEILSTIAFKDPKVKLIKFNKNYGQTLAVRAGLNYSKGDIIVFIDGDLQNNPEDIPALLDKIEDGYDIVSGWRKNRRDKFFTKILPSIIANKIICLITGIKLRDIGCSLKVYRRAVLEKIEFYGEIHRLIPIYAFYNGAKITEMPVSHNKRIFGKPKYGLNRIFKVFLDIISAYYLGRFSTKPIYFFGSIGLLFLLFSAVLFLFIILRVIVFGGIWISPLLLITIMLFLVGSQVILMGLLAEILMKLYYQNTIREPYIIKTIIKNGIGIEKEKK